MRINVEELKDRAQTGRAIYKSARKYRDLGIHLDDSLQNFYNYVKKIPYKEDSTDEVVSRPKYMIPGPGILGKRKYFPGLDCKKKAVLIGAWLNAHGIPWRLVAVSERKDKKIHHVFPQALIDGQWQTIDATYPEFNLFQAKPEVTKAEELLK